MDRADAMLPLWGLCVLVPLMLAAWAWQRRTRNAGVVDLLWAGGLGGFAILYAAAASGWWPRRVLVAVLASAWAARLCAHLWTRLRSEPEDGRYAELRTRLGERFQSWILVFFLLQALLAAVLSIAYLVPSAASAQGFAWNDVLAVAVWTGALAGESIADRQLRRWRAQAENAGLTCRTGLWRYSRHPNFFFEWLHWFAYPLLAVGLPLGWAGWIAPALMLFLILRVTGIPPTERQALRSRGDDYRDYQRTTPAFFPGSPSARMGGVQTS